MARRKGVGIGRIYRIQLEMFVDHGLGQEQITVEYTEGDGAVTIESKSLSTELKQQ